MTTWLTTEAVADKLGRNIDTIRRYCREGRFPHATRRWGDWTIPATDLDPDTPAPLIAPPSRRSLAQQKRKS